MSILVPELLLTQSYLPFYPSKCSLKMQPGGYTHPCMDIRKIICMALSLSDQRLHFPSEGRSSGCRSAQGSPHQLLSLHGALVHSHLCEFAGARLHSCRTVSLPSFLYAQGTLSLQPPFLPAHSSSHELCICPLSSLFSP